MVLNETQTAIRDSVRDFAQKEIRQIFPKPGWVEHDPQEIWFSQIAAAVEALAQVAAGGLDPRYWVGVWP